MVRPPKQYLLTMQPIVLVLFDFIVFGGAFKSSKVFQKDAFTWKGSVIERPKSKAVRPMFKELDVNSTKWIKLKDEVMID